MKIISLRLKNINSFKEDIHLDFTKEPLCTASLFAITGPTGSGKTTLLDAISVALYNKTPRLDGKGNKSQVNLLSQGTDEGFSEVVFQVNGTRYLAEWRAKRKKNGKIEPRVKLINAATGGLITSRRSSRNSRDMADMSVEEAVTKILGMDFGAFKRSILLAQGEFASFLKADAEKKREILEATTGMDLYEQLKENLNLQVRSAIEEFGKAEAAMGAIPAVSPEEIEEVREELAAMEAELQRLSSQKTGLGIEKEKEHLRVDSHRKLDGSRKQQLELTSRKNEIECLKTETEQALKAADIRSELDSYLSEKGQLEDVQVQLETTGKALEEARTGFESARSDYENSSQSFEQARIEAGETRKLYDQAAVYETEGRKLLQEAAKKQDEASALDQKIKQQQDLIRQKRDEISALEESAAGDRSFLEQHPLPDNVENLLAQASEVAARLAGKEETLKQRNDTLQKSEAACQSLKDKLSGFARKKALIENLKTKQCDLLENNTKTLQPFIIEGDEGYWRTIRSAWNDVQSAADELLQSYDRLSLTFEGILTDSRHEFNKTLGSYRERMERLTLEIKAIRERMEQCEAEEKLAIAGNQAFVLRQEHLKRGEPCPVCGSIEHPGVQAPEPDTEKLIETARENVQIAGSDLETSNKKLVAAARELAGLARDRAGACDEKIQNIESLSKEKVKIGNELQLLDEKIQSISSQEESLDLQKETIKQEMDDLTSQITGLVKEIAEHRTYLNSLIPGPPETVIETFKALIRSVRQAKDRLEANNKKLVEHRTAIEQINRHLEEDINRHERLIAGYTQYKLEGDSLIAQVNEMTGGLGVDAARSALDAHIKDLEKQRDDRRSFYDQAQTGLAGLRSKAEGLETDHERFSTRFAAAESRYFQAIETSGFGSIEDHRLSFRDQDWLDGTNKIVGQYRQDVHTVEENIKALQAVFTRDPYNPDDLPDILQREIALNNSIDEKNNLKGDLSRKIKTMKENLQKRQEQEKLLDKTKQEMDRWQKLAHVMPANSLRDFALKTMFDLLIKFANQQLSDITSRYALKAVDMKDMVVIDRWNAGEERPVETLSGGESFLVSLSLALALSELSSGRSRVESLFLDEGFGTLDPDTLDAALYALESLRLSGRTIGVISHIDQLTRRIPVRIEVKKMGNGSSGIQVKG